MAGNRYPLLRAGTSSDDRRSSAVASALVVVPDQVVVTVERFQAVQGQAAHLQRAAAGVAQYDIGRVEHRLNVFGGEDSVGEVPSQQVQVQVQLADDVFGDGLAGIVLVGILNQDAVRAVAGEAGRHRVE